MERCEVLSLLWAVGAMTTQWNSVVGFSATGEAVNCYGAWLTADPGEVPRSGSGAAAR